MPDLLAGRSPPSFDKGGRIQVRQTHLPANSYFFSDFGDFILKILKNENFGVFRKKNFKNCDFWADAPTVVLNRGDASPPSSPAATPTSTGECLLLVSASRGPVFGDMFSTGR